ncbi:MAG: prepilin-type N-terminal cleavage/methylation domain-containing protein [Lachnospiraceae bacterium]|nr:prepilin-type N-terminal cleavage/methylation domain-containing protein [Lachnospiraceae bacterium]
MVRAQVTRKLNNDKGFSLVELIIVVSILAIAAVPLMKSMGMAAKTNAKAQSIQNATSLGESIMEEMKSTPISDLKSKYGSGFKDNGTNYVIEKSEVTATQGEKFDVKVTIDKAKYSTPAPESGASKTDIVSAANVILLPEINSIDVMSQAVFTSEREFNKYDNEALNFFNQKIADYPIHKARIDTKTINIVKSSYSGDDYGVTVKASVTYTDTDSNMYVRDLYKGTFVRQEKADGSKKPLDSNIYIFYKVGKITDAKDSDNTELAERELRETIDITDTDDYSTFADPSIPNACHRVYFIGQDPSDATGPEIIINGNTAIEYSDFPTYTTPVPTTTPVPDGVCLNGIVTYGNVRFISNIMSVGATGHVYEQSSRTRVYDITVELFEEGDGTPITTLNSTRTEGITPTPTPIPTS